MPQNQYKISTKLVCPWYVFVLRFSSSITDIFSSWNTEFKFRSFLQCITHPVFSCGGARLGTLIEFVITCSRLGLAKSQSHPAKRTELEVEVLTYFIQSNPACGGLRDWEEIYTRRQIPKAIEEFRDDPWREKYDHYTSSISRLKLD